MNQTTTPSAEDLERMANVIRRLGGIDKAERFVEAARFTRDGAPVVAGMKLYAPNYGGFVPVRMPVKAYGPHPIDGRGWGLYWEPSDCYAEHPGFAGADSTEPTGGGSATNTEGQQ